MKKATLNHDDVKGFILVDENQEFITKVNAGDNSEEPDWQEIEAQANALGYTIAE